ncbi:hypothetical protein [Kingella denitrificans]|uniref:hypothetical protein n=1 Tax=Kingella denitrificans TaxID=502 RepID=UPI00288B74A8|nr:hypothetical protein [Kingella denitrificans]
MKTEVQAAFGMRRIRPCARQSRQKGGSLCHGRPPQARVWRRNAMPTAATHRLRGKKSSLHDAEAVQAPFNPL